MGNSLFAAAESLDRLRVILAPFEHRCAGCCCWSPAYSSTNYIVYTSVFIAFEKSREVFFHIYKLRSQTTPRLCSIFCFTHLSKAPGKRQPVKCFCWGMIFSLDQSVRLWYFSSSLFCVVILAVGCRVIQPFHFLSALPLPRANLKNFLALGLLFSCISKIFTLLIPVDTSFIQYQIMWLLFRFGPLSVTVMVTDSTSLPSLCSEGWEICSVIWGSWIGTYNFTLNYLAVFADLDVFTNSPLMSTAVCENVNAFHPFF